jgi:hypothetical protein
VLDADSGAMLAPIVLTSRRLVLDADSGAMLAPIVLTSNRTFRAFVTNLACSRRQALSLLLAF